MRQIQCWRSWETRVEKHNIFTFQIRIKTHFKIQDTPWHIIKFALHQHKVVVLSCHAIGQSWLGGYLIPSGSRQFSLLCFCFWENNSFTISCYFTLFYFTLQFTFLCVFVCQMDVGWVDCLVEVSHTGNGICNGAQRVVLLLNATSLLPSLFST